MDLKHLVLAFLLFMACAGLARTTEPELPVPWLQRITLVQDKQPDKDKKATDKKLPDLLLPDKEKKEPEPKLTDPPQTDAFAQTPTTGGQVLPYFNPNMLGDFSTYFARQNRTIFGTQTTVVTVDGYVVSQNTITVSQSKTILVPIASRGAFNIAENECARPQDRVFFTYNPYRHLQAPFGTNDGPTQNISSNTQKFTIDDGEGGISTHTINTTTTTVFPGVTSGVPRTSLHRETLGFEKTFLDGYASIEMRLPLLQQLSSEEGFSARNVGDLTIVGKYAFMLDRQTGNVLSGGLAVTAPTGPGIPTIEGTLHSTLLQPYVGYIWNRDRFFVQGFHAFVVPTDSRDVTLLCNDIGLGYWLYRSSDTDRPLRSIVPTLEAHVTTPLNHRSADSPLVISDLVVITGGVHLGLFRNTTLTVGVATPATIPRIFAVEGFLQLNWNF